MSVVAVLAVSGVWYAVLAALNDSPRRRAHGVLIWALIFLYPGVFAVIAGRSVYFDAPQDLAVSSSLGGLAKLSSFAAAGLCLGALPFISRRNSGNAILLVAAMGLVGLTYFSDAAKAGGPFLPSLQVIFLCLIFIAIFALRESAEVLIPRLRVFLRLYVLGGLAAAVIIPSWALVPPEFGGRAWLPTRLIGFTSSTNYMALIAGMAFVFELVDVRRGSWWRFYAFLALIACVWAQGRTGLAVAVFGFVTLRLFSRNRVRVLIQGICFLTIFGLSVGVLFQLFGNNVFGKNGLMELNKLTTGRLAAWHDAWGAFLDHPVIGRGSDFFTPDFWDAMHLPSLYANAHNQMLQSLGQTGIVGAAVMVSFLIALIAASVRSAGATRGASLCSLVFLVVQLPFGAPLLVGGGLTWNLIPVACCFGLAFTSATVTKAGSRMENGVESAPTYN